jgi:hypothetical protein
METQVGLPWTLPAYRLWLSCSSVLLTLGVGGAYLLAIARVQIFPFLELQFEFLLLFVEVTPGQKFLSIENLMNIALFNNFIFFLIALEF